MVPQPLSRARLRDALKLDPGSYVALVDLASLLYADGDYDAALEAYQLSLKAATDIIERAQRRLADISGLRRRHRQYEQADRNP